MNLFLGVNFSREDVLCLLHLRWHVRCYNARPPTQALLTLRHQRTPACTNAHVYACHLMVKSACIDTPGALECRQIHAEGLEACLMEDKGDQRCWV